MLPSPCIAVCTIDEDTGYCLGCARTLQEVTRWRRLNDEQQQAVLDALPARKEAMQSAGVEGRWRSD